MNGAKRKEIYARLRKQNPHPTTELVYSTPFELLIAVVLSAQATDVGVNKATAQLFPVANTPEKILGLGLAGLAFAVGLGLFLRYGTDAALPTWDAGTTSFSLVAQWMTTRKWIENWKLWIAVDVVYVGMYLSQGLYPTAALYVTFLVLAVLGYREWLSSLHTADEGETL